MDQVKVNIDLASLSLEVEGSTEFATSIVETFLGAVKEREVKNPRANQAPVESPAADDSLQPENGSGSSARKGGSRKPSTYEFLKTLLNPEAGRALIELYEQKKPKGQKEETLVLMKGLKDALGKDTFSYNELFTAFRTVKATVPKSLKGVISNLRIDTHVVGTGDELTLHYTGEDFVDKKLPAGEKTKK